MSTSMAFVELSDRDVTLALRDILIPRLKEYVLSRAPGHCMRIANLDMELMIALSLALRKECSNVQIYILAENGNPIVAEEEYQLFISSTKLVELRNPLSNGEQRPPLLVFLPANLHASAEDSFGIATFEDIPVADAYDVLLARLMEQVPSPLQGYVQDLLSIPGEVWWPWANQVAQIRFFLTAIKNRVDGESLGVSLYELGLVPDFRLFDDPVLMPNRIRRNLESVRKLTHSEASIRGRVLELGLSDKSIQRRLIQFLSEIGIVDPTIWTRQILAAKANRELSFDKWKFIDEIISDKVAIEILGTNIPKASEKDTDERLEGLSGQSVLNPLVQTRFSVTFRVEPYPFRVPSLHHFTAQIFTRNGEPVGGAKRITVWTTKKNEQTVHLDKLNKLDFEDGWHIVRILPWTKDDEPIPLEAPHRTLDDERGRLHESEPFYVLLEGEVAELPQRAIPWESSLEHAKLRVQFKELAEQRDISSVKIAHVLWMNKSSKSPQVLNEVLEIKFDRGGKFHINISRHLKALEQRILSDPTSVVNWRWPIQTGKTVNPPPIPDNTQWPRSAAVESFLDARTHYCMAIRAQAKNDDAILQAVDLASLQNEAIEYAEAYRDLLADLAQKISQSRGSDQQKTILALQTMLALDTVHMLLTDFRGRTKEAVLLGPTHPLRALWFATWTQVAQYWLQETKDGPEEYLVSVRDGLLNGLVPLNVPVALPCTGGRIFTNVDNINPFWSLYASPTEEDTRGLLGEVCALLGLSEPAIGADVITSDVLAIRISRYLVQHPYIRTLSINAFNPGRATILAQTITQLQKSEAFGHLRYDVRLFVPDPATPRVGEAIEGLLTPTEATISSDNVEVFSVPGRSHLFPKLSLAVHSLQAFYDHPDRYRAHLSMLFDLFPAEEIGAGPAFNPEDTVPLYGLLQNFVTDFRDNEEGTFWRRQPRHGHAQPLPNADDSTTLLAHLARDLSGAIATVATSVAAFEQRPIVTLSLNTAQREIIHHIHNFSDWVITIDRNIGVEFFDHGGHSNRPEYLIDYTPGNSDSSGHRLITTSRALLELEATLNPLLKGYNLPAEQHEAALILDQLRALSGRLAFKLISSPQHQTEALGLALARLFLLEQGVLANQIIVPLDVHLDLFQVVKRVGEEIGEAVSLQRTDLALFDLNATTRTIRCSLIEVKCYYQVGGLSAYAQLKESIFEQIMQSENVLSHHFDPARKVPDRPDRLLKTHELRVLLEFYLGRSERYELMQRDVADEARFLLAHLEEGYTLTFTHSALIFDLEQTGLEPPELEQGIEFYHVGKDYISALLTDLSPLPADAEQSESREQTAGPVPHFPSAAFTMPARDRSAFSTTSKSGEKSAPSRQDYADQAADEKALAASEIVDDTSTYEDTASIEEYTADMPEDTAGEETNVVNLVRPEARIVPEQGERPPYSVILGNQGASPQYGILGEVSGKKVALDLNQTHTISLFGVQGSGKSYTLGSIVEMACLPIQHINELPRPLATVIFHYSPTQDYRPEFTSMVYANSDPSQVTQLQDRYGASPQPLRDILLLVPASKVAERKNEYPDIEVQPITFAASELKAVHWKFLMGAVGSHSMYMREINLMMRQLRDRLTLEGLRQEVENADMSERLKKLAQNRLRFASEYIDDTRRLTDTIHPGRLIIVDVRDEFIEKDEALGLFVVLLQIFSEATYQGQSFNKLVVFDEAHKYIESQDLISGLIEVVREMRHKGTSIMVASQDPPSVPVALIELSSQIILHRCNSPAWLKHIQKANSSLNNLTPEKMSHLGAGEAYIWSARATDEGFTRGAVKVKLRPRITQHGGDTKTAVVQ